MKKLIKVCGITNIIVMALCFLACLTIGVVMLAGGLKAIATQTAEGLVGVLPYVIGIIFLIAAGVFLVIGIIFSVAFSRRMKGKSTMTYDITALVINVVAFIAGIIVAVVYKKDISFGLIIIILSVIFGIYAALCVADDVKSVARTKKKAIKAVKAQTAATDRSADDDTPMENIIVDETVDYPENGDER